MLTELNTENEYAWDEETGAPGVAVLSSAIETWAWLQDSRPTLEQAAAAFVATVQVVRECIEWSGMHIEVDDHGQEIIEHAEE